MQDKIEKLKKQNKLLRKQRDRDRARLLRLKELQRKQNKILEQIKPKGRGGSAPKNAEIKK